MGIFDKPNLRELAEKGDIDGLIKVLYSKDEALVEEATEALVKIGEKAIDPLIKQLCVPTSVVTRIYERSKTLEFSWPTSIPLARIGKPAIDSLILALKVPPPDPLFGNDFEIKKSVGAAITLGLIGDKQALQPLIESLEQCPDPRGSAMALGMIGDPLAVEPLIKSLSKKDPKNENHKLFIMALGKIGDKRAVQPLIEILSLEPLYRAENFEKFYFAVLALSEIRDERAVEPLIKGLSAKDHGIRAIAAIALGKIGDKRAVESLKGMLLDKKKYWDVGYLCITAAEALWKIDDKAGIDALINALSDKQKDLRIHAAKALGKLGDIRAIEPLTQALKDKKKTVQEAAKEAIDEINSKIREKERKQVVELTGIEPATS